MKDMTNLKELEPGKWRIRFKFTCPLTLERRVYQHTMDGTYREAREHRDYARAVARREQKPETDPTPLRSFTNSFLTHRATRGRRKIQKSTLLRDANAIKHHIDPDCGDWVVGRITRRDVEDLIDFWLQKTDERVSSTGKPLRRKKYSPSTVAGWLKTLRLFMRYACDQIGRADNPVDEVEGIATTPRESTALTLEQVRAVLQVAQEHETFLYPFFLIGFTTGARFSEISALRWEDVEDGLIRFTESQYQGRRRKGNKTNRMWTFPIYEQLAEALEQHRQQMLRDQRWGMDTGLVFPAHVRFPDQAAANGHIWPNTVRKALQRCCRSAGVPEITTHDMRVTFNTIALDHGIAGEILRTVTGHRDERMTAYYYRGDHDTQRETFGPIVRAMMGLGSEGDG